MEVTMEDHNYDFLATEIFAELKANYVCMHQQLMAEKKSTRRERIFYLVTIFLIVAGFLLYMYQYDYVSYETHSAEGVYAIVDSDGNVVATDLTEDELAEIVGYNDGESDSYESSSTQEEESVQ